MLLSQISACTSPEVQLKTAAYWGLRTCSHAHENSTRLPDRQVFLAVVDCKQLVGLDKGSCGVQLGVKLTYTGHPLVWTDWLVLRGAGSSVDPRLTAVASKADPHPGLLGLALVDVQRHGADLVLDTKLVQHDGNLCGQMQC